MEMFKRYTRSPSTMSTTTTGEGVDDVESGGFGHRRRNISDTEPLIGSSSNTSSINNNNSTNSNNNATSPLSASSSSSPFHQNNTNTNMMMMMSSHGTTTKDKDDDNDDHVSKTTTINGTTKSSGATSSTATTANTSSSSSTGTVSSGISQMGYIVLFLLAIQNCSKNLLMRYVMKDAPKFFTSTAVLCCECMKFTLSVVYITMIQKKSFRSIYIYLKYDMRNTLLLAVPATAYNFQMKLEYVALTNLNAAIFSVLVQTKLLCTAIMAYVVLRKQLKYIQIISLVLLTVGVMLCNLSGSSSSSNTSSSTMMMDSATLTGVMATLGIAMSSGFASVYTEKVIKANRSVATTTTTTNSMANSNHTSFDRSEYGLAYTQVQLAFMSICTIGLYALWQDLDKILEYGMFYQFSFAAWFSVLNSAIGGLIVASVLKYADSVLKGYATAMSVILTGILSMILFNTSLSIIYFLGIVNVVTAVLLYNGKDLDRMMC